MKAGTLKRLLSFILFICIGTIVLAQPTFTFTGTPTVSGAPGQVGTKYTWPNVGSSNGVTVKATIQIMAINGGALLGNIDGNNFGYDEAWQPVINGPLTPEGSCWGIEFMVSFYDASTGNPMNLRSFNLTGVDIDGDNENLREYNSFEIPNYFIVENPTTLTLWTDDPGFYKFQSAKPDHAGIEAGTTSIAVDVHYRFMNSFRIKLGSCCEGGDCAATGLYRLHCEYFGEFKNFTKPDTVYASYQSGVLPLSITRFSGIRQAQLVTLNWHTEDETDMLRYYIEKSCDGTTFTTIGSMASQSDKGTSNDYSFNIPAASICDASLFRLKCISMNGQISYSKTISLSQPGMSTINIAYHEGNLHVQYTGRQSVPAFIKIMDINNKPVYQGKMQLSSGDNLQLIPNATSLSTGIYIFQLETPSSTITQKVYIQNK